IASIDSSSILHIKELELINLFFWIIIIICLISIIGTELYVSGNFSYLGRMMMLAGCVTIIFNILVIYLHLNFIISTENISNLSAASINNLPIRYAYFPLIIAIISSIYSISCFWSVISLSMKSSRKIVKKHIWKRKHLDESEKSKDLEKKFQPEKEQIALDEISPVNLVEGKKEEIEQWLNEEIQHMKKSTEPEKKLIMKQEEPSKIEYIQTTKPEEPTADPFSSKNSFKDKKECYEKPVSKELSSEDISTTPSFEEALSYAIEKRQKYRESDEVSVRCPQCEYIFNMGKEVEEAKIKCPKCGKEGITR
ncbi:MAG: hypothetical protein JSW62_05500, partial [Thermoplasmatales archaeon]